MPLAGHPLCWNPVAVQIVQLNAVQTVAQRLDPDFNETQYGQDKIYTTTLNLQAQIAYGIKDKQTAALTGDPASAAGHLTFRSKDLELAGIVLKKGDLVKKIEDHFVDFKVIEARPTAHLRGNSWLTMVFFAPNDETRPSIRR